MFTLAKTDKGTVIEIGLNVSGPDYDDVLKSSAQYSHLITSAPELLEALISIVDRSHNGELGSSKVIDMRKIAEGAIAKALGEQK